MELKCRVPCAQVVVLKTGAQSSSLRCPRNSQSARQPLQVGQCAVQITAIRRIDAAPMFRLEGRHGEPEFGVGAGEGVGREVEGGLGGGVAEGGEVEAAGLEGQDAVALGEAVPGGAGLRRVEGGLGAVRVAALGLVETVVFGLGAVVGGPAHLRQGDPLQQRPVRAV